VRRGQEEALVYQFEFCARLWPSVSGALPRAPPLAPAAGLGRAASPPASPARERSSEELPLGAISSSPLSPPSPQHVPPYPASGAAPAPPAAPSPPASAAPSFHTPRTHAPEASLLAPEASLLPLPAPSSAPRDAPREAHRAERGGRTPVREPQWGRGSSDEGPAADRRPDDATLGAIAAEQEEEEGGRAHGAARAAAERGWARRAPPARDGVGGRRGTRARAGAGCTECERNRAQLSALEEELTDAQARSTPRARTPPRAPARPCLPPWRAPAMSAARGRARALASGGGR
jgi:hypothetical protein